MALTQQLEDEKNKNLSMKEQLEVLNMKIKNITSDSSQVDVLNSQVS